MRCIRIQRDATTQFLNYSASLSLFMGIIQLLTLSLVGVVRANSVNRHGGTIKPRGLHDYSMQYHAKMFNAMHAASSVGGDG
jgi:hypothetical protein